MRDGKERKTEERKKKKEGKKEKERRKERKKRTKERKRNNRIHVGIFTNNFLTLRKVSGSLGTFSTLE